VARRPLGGVAGIRRGGRAHAQRGAPGADGLRRRTNRDWLRYAMHKRLNWRFGLYLLTSLAVLGTGTHFLHGYQVRHNAGGLLDRARAAEEQGDLAKAADYLGRYLGLEPTDADALARYGLLLANEQLAKSARARFQAML